MSVLKAETEFQRLDHEKRVYSTGITMASNGHIYIALTSCAFRDLGCD